jgi:hypothetical protein
VLLEFAFSALTFESNDSTQQIDFIRLTSPSLETHNCDGVPSHFSSLTRPFSVQGYLPGLGTCAFGDVGKRHLIFILAALEQIQSLYKCFPVLAGHYDAGGLWQDDLVMLLTTLQP